MLERPFQRRREVLWACRIRSVSDPATHMGMLATEQQLVAERCAVNMFVLSASCRFFARHRLRSATVGSSVPLPRCSFFRRFSRNGRKFFYLSDRRPASAPRQNSSRLTHRSGVFAWRSLFSIKVLADVNDAVQKTKSLRVRGFPSADLLIVVTGTVLPPGVHCQVVSDVRRARAFHGVHPHSPPLPSQAPLTSSGGRGGWPWRLKLAFVLAFPDVHVFTSAGPFFLYSHSQRSCWPQPRESRREAAPREDTRQDC